MTVIRCVENGIGTVERIGMVNILQLKHHKSIGIPKLTSAT